jgi:hypothetical protein
MSDLPTTVAPPFADAHSTSRLVGSRVTLGAIVTALRAGGTAEEITQKKVTLRGSGRCLQNHRALYESHGRRRRAAFATLDRSDSTERRGWAELRSRRRPIYDILRWKGVPLGKRDFIGRTRVKK